jgi:Helix-turn-helix domain
MGTLNMSYQEIDRLGVIQACINKQLTQVSAAVQLQLSPRQVKRLVRGYRQNGVESLVSKRRGKPSNNQLPANLASEVTRLIKDNYPDFGPTLTQEKLAERHGLTLSVESVRKLMIKAKLWQPKTRRKARIHQSRERRACRGELVQIDGSPHDWFEGRGAKCTLIVFIDDATSDLLALHFAPTETTEAYMTAARDYLEREGRPVSFYSDKHGIFKVNAKGKEDEITQFGRAMKTLDIELICANTPQAKGRVERVNQTLQDRLVKEMRLAGISNIDDANIFVQDYMSKHNARFAVGARDNSDAHRPLVHNAKELDLIFSLHDTRKLSKNLTFKYKCREYQLQGYGQGYRLRHALVTVCERFTGEVTVLYDGQPLNYRLLTRHEPATPIVDAKNVDAHITTTRVKQDTRSGWKPAPDHPWKRGYSSTTAPL